MNTEQQGLIEEIDRVIADCQSRIMECQNQRAGALNMILRSKKIREGNWEYRAGALVRTDMIPVLVQNCLAARDANDHDLAVRLAKEAIGAGDMTAAPRMLWAACLGDLGRHEEALEVIARALEECSPDQHHFIFHERGFQRLLRGQFKEGWPDWDYRIQKTQMAENIAKAWPNLKEWDGSPNRRVLVCGEKGLGDSILFARYINVLLERNCTVQFLAGKASIPFMEVLRGRPGIFDVYGGEDAIPQVSEMWLPLESIPKFVDAIPAPFDFPVRWEPISRADRPLRVGLCWHGATGYSASKHRRPEDLKLWDPILEVGKAAGVEFISLQLGEVGPCVDELPASSTVLDTVRRACSCDLVISTDTSVVHMTASAGVPTWMPMHKLNYWPWIMADPQHTVWYPSMTIFGQKSDGWEGVFRELAEQLKAKTQEE